MQTVLLSESETICLDESISITLLETFDDCIRVQIDDPCCDPQIREETLYVKKKAMEVNACMNRSFSFTD